MREFANHCTFATLCTTRLVFKKNAPRIERVLGGKFVFLQEAPWHQKDLRASEMKMQFLGSKKLPAAEGAVCPCFKLWKAHQEKQRQQTNVVDTTDWFSKQPKIPTKSRTPFFVFQISFAIHCHFAHICGLVMDFHPILVRWGSKARLSFCKTIGLSLGCFSLFFAPCDIIVSLWEVLYTGILFPNQDQLLTSDWFLYELRISYGLVGTLSAPCFTWSLVAALVKRIDLSSDADGPSLGSFRILRGIAWRTVMSHGRFHMKSFVFVRLSKRMSQQRIWRWAKDKEALQAVSLIRCLPSADAVPCQMASITRRKNGKRRPWQEWAAWLLCSCFANLLSKVCPPKKTNAPCCQLYFASELRKLNAFRFPVGAFPISSVSWPLYPRCWWSSPRVSAFND